MIRITDETDLTRIDTVKFLKDIVKKATQKNLQTMVWVSIPCTAGCPWRHMNAAKGVETGDAQLTQQLIASAIKICEYAKARGADVTWEWPLRSDLWGDTNVHEMVNTLGGKFVKVATSAVDLSHQMNGETVYTRKEWCLYSTDAAVRSAFANYSVDLQAESKKFVWCRGKIARESAVYTPLFAKIYWVARCVALRRAQALVAKPVDEYPEEHHQDPEHREHDMPPTRPMWCSLITRIVKPRSKEAQCEDAQKAIRK